ncbi:MAG TPA: N-acetylmuramoyl-L-alanine amidase [Chitinophagaceae bacterium]|nr:N-acetylmuramoyl-L-alanine amidase [Chitinophagaceae bacterium]
MKITDHTLIGDNNKAVDFQATPNKGGKYTPLYLVMHYTATTEARGSISWFLNKQAKASAHLIIDRDGTITQFAPFNVITWHAGESEWNGLIGLNKHAVGIELVNGGKLVRGTNGWICSVDKKAVPETDVVIARHKNEANENGWQAYTDKQIQTSIEVATLIVRTYDLKNVIGHDDIAPHRKSDPGPAFPMGSFRSRVMGRKDNEPKIHFTTTDANIRSGAGTQFPALTDPLPKNTEVIVLKREGNWTFVEVIGKVNGLNDLEGWIFSKYLVEE